MKFDQQLAAIWDHKIRFVFVFFLVFTVLYGTLFVLDFLPEPPTESVTSEAVTPTETELVTEPQLPPVEPEPLNIEIVEEVVEEPEVALLPDSIYIEKLDKTIPVLNPTSRTIADLDVALLSGVVRHPDSASLNQDGNVFILGHSSYLPSVRNKHFQAFNGIQNLEWGDFIEVTGEETTYVYRVEKVYKAKASEVTVPIADTGSMLTLATCNSFGSTDDRYIVEASLYKTV